MQPLSVENNEKVWTQLLYQYISENHHKDLITCMICFIGGLAKSSSFWCTGEKKVSQITGRGSLVGFEYKHTGSKTIVNSQIKMWSWNETGMLVFKWKDNDFFIIYNFMFLHEERT